MAFLTFLMTFTFTFFISYTSNANLEGEELPCRGKTCSKMYLNNKLDVKKVSATGAGRLRECKNTEFVCELWKTGFLWRWPLVELSAYESVRLESFHCTVKPPLSGHPPGMFFEGTTGAYERINCFNSKWIRKKEKYANSKCVWRNVLFAH